MPPLPYTGTVPAGPPLPSGLFGPSAVCLCPVTTGQPRSKRHALTGPPLRRWLLHVGGAKARQGTALLRYCMHVWQWVTAGHRCTFRVGFQCRHKCYSGYRYASWCARFVCRGHPHTGAALPGLTGSCMAAPRTLSRMCAWVAHVHHGVTALIIMLIMLLVRFTPMQDACLPPPA